jgi:ubiquinone/menaquinone biosynthesis C-methylase UbiE
MRKFTSYYTQKKIAKKYDRIRYQTARGRFWDSLEKETIFSFFHGDRFLDLGCGTGRIAIEAKNMGFNVFALDISSEMLREAKSKNPSIAYVKGSVEEIPFKKDSFDSVAMFRIFCHLKTHKKVLNEAFRVLRTNGHFIFDVSNKFFSGRFFKIQRASEVYYPSKEHVEKEAIAAGFKIIGVTYFKTFLLASLLARFKLLRKHLKKIEKIMSRSPFKMFSDSFIFYLKK